MFDPLPVAEPLVVVRSGLNNTTIEGVKSVRTDCGEHGRT